MGMAEARPAMATYTIFPSSSSTASPPSRFFLSTINSKLTSVRSFQIFRSSRWPLQSPKLSADGRVVRRACKSGRSVVASRRNLGGARARVGSEGFDGSAEEGTNALADCLEIAADGTRFLHVMASSMHNVDHGSIIGLTCIALSKDASSARNLEFPLFLNGLSSLPIKNAVDKGGLPHALEELGELQDLDLEKIYVISLDNARTGGEFLVYNDRKGERFKVASTFPQAIAIALRYQQPFFLKREALLSANTDFVNRMLINPLAREQDGDVEWLAELSERMQSVIGRQSKLQGALTSAVDAQKFEEALRLKQVLIAYDKQMDVEALQILQRLRTLYLERMGIFFKL